MPTILPYLLSYAVGLATFLLVDLLWIGIIARGFYRKALAGFLREEFLLGPAVLFYLCYVAILCYLVVVPAFEAGQFRRLLLGAALFGLAAYGTYDITNYALLKGWPLSVTLADMAWGSIVTSVSAISAYVTLRLMQ